MNYKAKRRRKMRGRTKWMKEIIPIALVGGLQTFIPYKMWGRTVVYRIEWREAAK